jgi:hypothetical protein
LRRFGELDCSQEDLDARAKKGLPLGSGSPWRGVEVVSLEQSERCGLVALLEQRQRVEARVGMIAIEADE